MKLPAYPKGFRIFARSLFFLFVFCLGGPAAWAYEAGDDSFQDLIGANRQTALTVLYTATSRGEMYPCPTCGETALGGLARRAAFINDTRRSKGNVLVISGPDEMLSDNDILRFKSGNATGPGADFNPDKAKQLLAAHSLLRVDAGYLSPQEAAWLKATTGKLPSKFHEVAVKPVTATVETAFGKVGIVFFPHGEERFGLPSARQKDEALAAGKAISGKVNLVFGVSPWGSTAEERFLPQADGVFSVLFGGGPGLGFAHSTQRSTKSLLWVRSENQGRAVNVLTILEMPPVGVTPNWLEDVSFSARQEFLKASVPSDPAMLKIIGTNDK